MIKKILLKFANYIFRKYNATPIFKLNQRITFQDNIYYVHSITLNKSYGCVDELKISCHGIMEVLDGRYKK